MDRTTVIMIKDDSDESVGADVLERSDKRIKIALDGSDITLILTRNRAQDKWYTAIKFGMTFQTTGE